MARSKNDVILEKITFLFDLTCISDLIRAGLVFVALGSLSNPLDMTRLVECALEFIEFCETPNESHRK